VEGPELTFSRILGALLQWGHGNEAVEGSATTAQYQVTVQLQWGHGNEAVEGSRADEGGRRGASSFNGATAMKPWKGPL